MYELIRAGKNTYYIDCPAKIGLYKINENDVCLIDSGNDKSAGKKVLDILENNNWNLSMIINTHSHADHIGGNRYLQEKTGCKIYCAGIDAAFANNPLLEPSYLYGGYPFKNIRNKFLMAQGSNVDMLTDEILPEGIQIKPIDGHTFSMSAIKTNDDIWFLADSVTDKAILDKYHIFYMVDVQKYLESLDEIAEMKGKLFIPSHAMPTDDIRELIKVNKEKTHEVSEFLLETCEQPKAFDDILKGVFEKYDLNMNSNQHVLVGSTIKSHLSYLNEMKKINIIFKDNKMLWQKA